MFLHLHGIAFYVAFRLLHLHLQDYDKNGFDMTMNIKHVVQLNFQSVSKFLYWDICRWLAGEHGELGMTWVTLLNHLIHPFWVLTAVKLIQFVNTPFLHKFCNFPWRPSWTLNPLFNVRKKDINASTLWATSSSRSLECCIFSK